MPFPGFHTDQIKPAAWFDDLPKTDFFAAAKSDEPLPADVSSHKEAGQLRRGLNHDHARQERPARDMPRHPELIGPNILEADKLSLFGLGPDDGVKMFHVPALRIRFAHAFLVEEDLVQVNAADVVEEWRWHDEVMWALLKTR